MGDTMVGSDKLAIRSAFVCIGTLRCSVIRPTVVSSDYITVNIKEGVQLQRLSLQIAFKHILSAQMSYEGQQRGLALNVNHYCARRIRESLSVESDPTNAFTDHPPYFDPESSCYCNKFIVIDINACGKEDLTKLHMMLCDVQRRKAEGSLMPRSVRPVNNSLQPFLTVMSPDDYERLLRELGEQTAGALGNAPLRQQPSNTIVSHHMHVPATKRRSLDVLEGDVERKQSRGRSSRPTSPPLIRMVPRTSYTVVAAPLAQNSPRLGHVADARIGWTPVASTSSAVVVPVLRSPNPNGALGNGTTPPRAGDEDRRLTRLAAQRKVVHTIEEDDPTDQKKEPADNGCMLVYPNEGPDKLAVHFADVELLKPEQMLNDTIIDFFLKYIHCEMVPLHRRQSMFIFNSFFYSKLTSNNNGGAPPRKASSRAEWVANNYKSVRTWTKNVDLFSKEYIVVPINEDIHWYLAIITDPSAAIQNKASGDGKKRRKTHIIILDSLTDHLDPKRKLTAPILREYLCCEYNDKRKPKAAPEETFVKEQVEKVSPRKVPQQRNYTDCGLFLLKFAECFLTNPPMLVTRSDDFLRWYPRFNIKDMRASVLGKVQALCSPDKWNQFEGYVGGRSDSSSQPDVSSSTDAGGLVPLRSPSPTPRLRSYSTGDEESEKPVKIRRPMTP